MKKSFIITSNCEDLEYIIINKATRYAVKYTQQMAQIYNNLSNNLLLGKLDVLTLYETGETNQPFKVIYKIWLD